MALLVIISKEMELKFSSKRLLCFLYTITLQSAIPGALCIKKTLSLKCDLYSQGGLDIEFGDQDLSKVLPILENLHWVMLGSAHGERAFIL